MRESHAERHGGERRSDEMEARSLGTLKWGTS